MSLLKSWGYWVISLCFISLGLFSAAKGFRSPWKIFNDNRLDYSLNGGPCHGFALGIMGLTIVLLFSVLLGLPHLMSWIFKKINKKGQ